MNDFQMSDFIAAILEGDCAAALSQAEQLRQGGAGPVQAILPYYAKAGVHIANVDYCVDVAEARNLLPDTCLDGNIKSLSFVEESPANIEAESLKLLRGFRDRGGFILSSGCEIPPESKPENIAAMVEAARTDG